MPDQPPHVDRIQVRDLVKIFGQSPGRALELLDAGVPRDEIRRRTSNVVAVNRVTFNVHAGETFVVMGLSGSGKSTLVRCLNRLLEPTAGHVVVDGRNLLAMTTSELKRFRRERVAMVFQHFALLPHRTVLENVEFGLKIQGTPKSERRERATSALTLVGLEAWATERPRTLSGGMQQRVGLARALATDPDVLLMDEPFSALDPLIRRDMQDDLLDLQRRLKKTIVFITHDITEALRLGDRIAVLREGQIIQVAPPTQLVEAPADDYVANFVRGVDRGTVLKVADILVAAPVTREPPQGSYEPGHPIFVVDEGGRPVGMHGAADRSRGSEPRDSVADLPPGAGFVCIQESATIDAAYSACAAGIPVAVVDADGRLTGTVSARDVLGALATDQSNRDLNRSSGGTARA
jgi:glycine betaine/proline transport system ATP-binding protein